MRNQPQRAIYTQTEPKYSYVRFLNTAPSSPIDFYADGVLIKHNLTYGDPSDYFKFKPGSVTFEGRISDTGESTGIATFILSEDSASMIAGIGMPPEKYTIIQIPESSPSIPLDKKALLRFVNLSSDTPPLSVSFANGPILFENITYPDYTNYYALNPGNYNFSFNSPYSGLNLFSDLNVQLLPDMRYSIYAIGNNINEIRRSTFIVADSLY